MSKTHKIQIIINVQFPAMTPERIKSEMTAPDDPVRHCMKQLFFMPCVASAIMLWLQISSH